MGRRTAAGHVESNLQPSGLQVNSVNHCIIILHVILPSGELFSLLVSVNVHVKKQKHLAVLQVKKIFLRVILLSYLLVFEDMPCYCQLYSKSKCDAMQM